MTYILLILFCIAFWIIFRFVPPKMRYVIWVCIILFLIFSFTGAHSYRWHRLTSELSQLAR